MRRRHWTEPSVRYHRIADLRHAVYEWKAGPAPRGETVVFLHGWMDTARAFTPLVANLGGGRRYLGVDWRGFGATDRAPDGRYLVPDYLADLDQLLTRELAEGERVILVGHSLGGNVAGLYAGIRPDRVNVLISLEGFGLPDGEPEQAPERYRTWLASARDRPERGFRSGLAFARHIKQLNPRLSSAMAAYLADCWSTPDGQGGVTLRADPAHRRPNPVLYRLEEVLACWRHIRAPVLWVHGEESNYANDLRRRPDWPRRVAAIDRLRFASVPGAGHALCHEVPQRLAAVLEANWPNTGPAVH